ncbi:Inosine-5'-monophosphate dehydrogenase [Neomoorella glycerini]|uniref:Inosine-5'-monophosphate dehydrogenase n=1 Tax=Neomoorella glycerini TaxID=55779 RepID=A0A6I5ZVH0_9FIRM|nr:GGDEF domain-containing protein [Moorella glycerini]QGP94000.1 Inosine-5'-monophosphate dehydrogenase [Moorella glycerini]
MPTVEGLISQKLYTIDPLASVGRAASIMERYGIGSLPVIEEGKLVGIITSRDIRRSHPNRLVADAMTSKVITVPPTTCLTEAQKLMAKYKIERLVVTRESDIIGIVTRAQIMSELGKHTDSLTGLNKAEIFYEKALELLKEGQEIAVIFLDLDNFGFINKEYGHIYGDNVLRQTALILNSLIDSNRDTLCRYAGDEFAAVTTRPLAEAEKLARQMVLDLANENWPGKIKVAISAGVAGGRCSELRSSGEDSSYIVKYLVNMASLASTRAKKLKKPVVAVEAIELKETVGM